MLVLRAAHACCVHRARAEGEPREDVAGPSPSARRRAWRAARPLRSSPPRIASAPCSRILVTNAKRSCGVILLTASGSTPSRVVFIVAAASCTVLAYLVQAGSCAAVMPSSVFSVSIRAGSEWRQAGAAMHHARTHSAAPVLHHAFTHPGAHSLAHVLHHAGTHAARALALHERGPKAAGAVTDRLRQRPSAREHGGGRHGADDQNFLLHDCLQCLATEMSVAPAHWSG